MYVYNAHALVPTRGRLFILARARECGVCVYIYIEAQLFFCSAYTSFR